MEFLAAHTAINASIVVTGEELFGVDLMSWATLPSLRYSGGPYADALLSLAGVYGGSEVERSLALDNLQSMFPSLENPRSIFIPGSYFAGDIVDALNADDPLTALGEFSGIRFLKPGEDKLVEKAFSWFDF